MSHDFDEEFAAMLRADRHAPGRRGDTAMQYDEEAELTRYIWQHCPRLMTDFERTADGAARAREKGAACDNETMARMLSTRWGLSGDPDVDSALSGGAEAFRRSVCRRILSERGDEIINRCPRCHRVLRAPKARQCFWCGHDCHGAAR
jgi:hypothetical protein